MNARMHAALYLSIYLSLSISIYLSIYLYLSLSIYLSIAALRPKTSCVRVCSLTSLGTRPRRESVVLRSVFSAAALSRRTRRWVVAPQHYTKKSGRAPTDAQQVAILLLLWQCSGRHRAGGAAAGEGSSCAVAS